MESACCDSHDPHSTWLHEDHDVLHPTCYLLSHLAFTLASPHRLGSLASAIDADHTVGRSTHRGTRDELSSFSTCLNEQARFSYQRQRCRSLRGSFKQVGAHNLYHFENSLCIHNNMSNPGGDLWLHRHHQNTAAALAVTSQHNNLIYTCTYLDLSIILIHIRTHTPPTHRVQNPNESVTKPNVTNRNTPITRVATPPCAATDWP